MDNKTIIYTLSHPITGEVRYIGMTTKTLKRRIREHMAESKKGKNRRCKWIRSLVKIELKPKIEFLDEVCTELGNQTEIYWIEQFKHWGFNLVNGTKGGSGISGYCLSEEHKRKISIAKLGKKRSPEFIENLKNHRKGINPLGHLCQDKLDIIAMGRALRASKSIRNKNTGEVFSSMKEASIKTGINCNTIRTRLKNNYITNEYEYV